MPPFDTYKKVLIQTLVIPLGLTILMLWLPVGCVRRIPSSPAAQEDSASGFATPTSKPSAIPTPGSPRQANDRTPDLYSRVLADFPLAPGATWEYNANILYALSDDATVAEWSGEITVQVVDRKSLADGSLTFTLREEMDPAPPGEVWRQPREYLYTLSADGVIDGDKKILQYPLSDGLSWETWPGAGYLTEVSFAGDIEVPYGPLSGCFLIALKTLPDATIRTFCPGVRFVALEYWYFGTPQEEKIEVTRFTPGQ